MIYNILVVIGAMDVGVMLIKFIMWLREDW